MTSMYVVEKIVGKRIRDGKNLQYRIKWKNYDSNQNTWEPVKNLKNVQNMIRDFENRNNDKHPLTSDSKKFRKTNRESSRGSSKSQNKNASQKQTFRRKFDENLNVAKRKSDRIIQKALAKNQPILLSQSESEDQESSEELSNEEPKKTQKKQQKNAKKSNVKDTTSQPNTLDLNLDTIATKIMTAVQSKKKSYTIVAIAKKAKGDADLYLVQDSEGNQQYKQRQYVLRNLPVELIAFYQRTIKQPKEVK